MNNNLSSINYNNSNIDNETKLQTKWFNDIIDKEIESVKKIISIQNQNSLTKSADHDKINDIHSYNISILEKYIKFLENKKITELAFTSTIRRESLSSDCCINSTGKKYPDYNSSECSNI